MRQCMGGWCEVRIECAHHHAEPSQLPQSERLCEVGQEEPLRDKKMANQMSLNHYSPAFRVLVLFIQNPELEMTSEEIIRKWPDLADGASIALRLRHYRRTGIFSCVESEKRLRCGAKELTWSAGPALLEMLD